MNRTLLLAIGLALAGCDDQPEPAATETAAEAPAAEPLYTPTRVLEYQGGANVTDLEITQRVTALRDAPATAADPYIAIAALFVRKAREAQDPSIYRIAEDAIRAALSREPENAAAMAMHAHILSQDHRFREAREVAMRVVRLKPDDTTARIVLGDAQLELGNYAEAVDAYQSAIDLRPDLRSYNRGAYMRYLHGDVEGAMELYQLALEAGDTRDPESMAWCHADRGDLLWTRGQLEAAKDAANAALTLMPNYGPALRLKAHALYAEGHVEDAIHNLQDAIHARELPEDVLALSEWLEAQGDTEGADARRERAFAIEREDPRAIAMYLARHDQQHDHAVELAREQVRQRRTIQSEDLLALALTRAGRLAEARQSMDRALRLGTQDPRMYLHDALLRTAESDNAGALASLSRANRLNPHIDERLAREIASRLSVAPDYVAPDAG